MKPRTSDRYAAPAITLHWLIALLIVVAFAVGLKLWGLPLSPLKFKLIAWHKWLGVTILALVLVRIAVRAVCTVPPLPAHMGPIEQRIAHLGHLALYLLMLAVPLSGWAMSSAYGIPVVYLGVIALPPLLPADPQLAATVKDVHQLLNLLLALSVAGHVLVALKHHVLDRDRLLDRMRFGRGRTEPRE